MTQQLPPASQASALPWGGTKRLKKKKKLPPPSLPPFLPPSLFPSELWVAPSQTNSCSFCVLSLFSWSRASSKCFTITKSHSPCSEWTYNLCSEASSYKDGDGWSVNPPLPARKLSWPRQLSNLPFSLQIGTMTQPNKERPLSSSVASVTGWSTILFHRIEDNWRSLLTLSSSHSVLLVVSTRFILREENCYSVEVWVVDSLFHYPRAVIPNCMQLGTNLIKIELGWKSGGDSDKFPKRFWKKKKKNVGGERHTYSVAKHICMRPQVQSPATPSPHHTHTNPVSEGKWIISLPLLSRS